MPPGHGRFDNSLLHGVAIRSRRLISIVVEAEPALEFFLGIVSFPTPSAVSVAARHISKTAHPIAGRRELVTHPRRHDRISAGHGQPGKREGQGPTVFVGGQYAFGLLHTDVPCQTSFNGVTSFGCGRLGRTDLGAEI